VSNLADHRERRYLEELANRLNVSVEFLTLVPHEELVRLYNQARLTLYAPIMEPFGFVPLESLACGTPVVGVCEGGVRETILHNKTGLLTDRDPRCFAEAIKDLLSDSDSRKQFGRQGRTYVERQWQWDRTVRNLENYLINVIQYPSGETF
jgi:glycosyltransferase involved in cell wall biosynthesis